MPGITEVKARPTILLQIYEAFFCWFFCRTVGLLKRIFNYFMSIFKFFLINIFTSASPIWTKEEQDHKAGLKEKRLFGFLIQTAFSRPAYQEKHLFAYQLWRCNRLEKTWFWSYVQNPFPTNFYSFLKDNVQSLILYADCWRSQHELSIRKCGLKYTFQFILEVFTFKERDYEKFHHKWDEFRISEDSKFFSFSSISHASC